MVNKYGFLNHRRVNACV